MSNYTFTGSMFFFPEVIKQIEN